MNSPRSCTTIWPGGSASSWTPKSPFNSCRHVVATRGRDAVQRGARDRTLKIRQIREVSVPLEGQVANAVVNFDEHDVSLVAVVTDAVRNGRPVVGYGFNSIGRFAQGGILRDRVVPRVMAAPVEQLFNGVQFD